MEYEVVADIVWQHTAVLPVITRKHKIQQQHIAHSNITLMSSLNYIIHMLKTL